MWRKWGLIAHCYCIIHILPKWLDAPNHDFPTSQLAARPWHPHITSITDSFAVSDNSHFHFNWEHLFPCTCSCTHTLTMHLLWQDRNCHLHLSWWGGSGALPMKYSLEVQGAHSQYECMSVTALWMYVSYSIMNVCQLQHAVLYPKYCTSPMPFTVPLSMCRHNLW